LLVCGRFWCLVYTVSLPTFPAARLPNKAHLQSNSTVSRARSDISWRRPRRVGSTSISLLQSPLFRVPLHANPTPTSSTPLTSPTTSFPPMARAALSPWSSPSLLVALFLPLLSFRPSPNSVINVSLSNSHSKWRLVPPPPRVELIQKVSTKSTIGDLHGQGYQLFIPKLHSG
jgi:hypothetical protein